MAIHASGRHEQAADRGDGSPTRGKKALISCLAPCKNCSSAGVPTGIRTPVPTVKG